MASARRGVLAVALAGVLSLPACGSSARPVTVPSSQPQPAATVTAGVHGVDVSDDLAILPIDSELVLSLNLKQLQRSALWGQYNKKLMDLAHATLEELPPCAFDLFQQLDRVALGVTNLGDDHSSVVLVLRGIDEAAAMACIKPLPGVTIDGHSITHVNGEQHTSRARFVAPTVLVLSAGPAVTPDALDKIVAGGHSLRQSPMFLGYYGELDPATTLWFLLNGSSKVFDAMGIASHPKVAFGSFNLTAGFNAGIRVRFASTTDAQQLLTAVDSQLPMVRMMFGGTVTDATEGADYKLTIAMTEPELVAALKKLLSLVSGK